MTRDPDELTPEDWAAAREKMAPHYPFQHNDRVLVRLDADSPYHVVAGADWNAFVESGLDRPREEPQRA